MTKSLVLLLAFALGWMIAPPPRAQADKPGPDAAPAAETPAGRTARLAWWREARFGLFLHWGPVSLQGTEIGWSRAASAGAIRTGRAPKFPLRSTTTCTRSSTQPDTTPTNGWPLRRPPE